MSKLKVVMELIEDVGLSIQAEGRISHTEKISLVHALGQSFNLDRMDWAVLAATADFDMHKEGYCIEIPVAEEE